MRAVALSLIASLACGRLGFDPATASGGDGAAVNNPRPRDRHLRDRIRVA
jgi:hypothetical protein